MSAMGHAGGRSRAFRGLFAAVLLSTGACAAIAGVSSKEVDPCFDGCGDGGVPKDGSSSDGPSPADNFVPDSPVNVDSGPCDCPKGTHLISGVCASDLPATNLVCASPLQLPDCPVKLALRVCDADPTFTYEPQCTGGVDAGRPSSFFRLGKSPTTKWKLTIVGSQNVARPTVACDFGGSPCGARDGGSLTGTTTFTSPSLPDNDSVVVGKADAPGCQDITITVEVAP